MSRPIDIRVPIDNIYFWPTVDVRDIDSMPGFAGSGVDAHSAAPASHVVNSGEPCALASPESSRSIASRIRYFRILPVTVIGNSCTKRM